MEPDKPRCPVSHFEFEEFRMLQFINSIRIYRGNNDVENDTSSLFTFEEENLPQTLTEEERNQIIPLFYRASKPNFTFKDISKKLCGKKNWKCNYRDDTNSWR